MVKFTTRDLELAVRFCLDLFLLVIQDVLFGREDSLPESPVNLKSKTVRYVICTDFCTQLRRKYEYEWNYEFQACMHLLSSSDSLMLVSAGLKTQAGQGGSTAYVATNFFSPFQKHCLITSMTLQFSLSNGVEWSVKHF
jgi:hypothetical protein